jgi:transcriptional regulator with XRE-family HTH domain
MQNIFGCFLISNILTLNNMSNIETFAQNLKKNRKTTGLSQEKLALMSDLDRTYIQLLESSKANPSIKVMDKLALTLGISIKDFFT